MITLDTTLKNLELKLAGAVSTTELPWTIAYVDISQSTFGVSSSVEGDGTSAGASVVTLAAAPSANLSREIKHISVFNIDTAAATVTIQINNNGTKRILWQSILQVGDTLEYEG